jgi:CRP-like cAMP-binding protein
MEAARLVTLPLFSGLSKRECQEVARWVDEVEVNAGTHLVDEGRFAYEFFVIQSGTADVTSRGELLGALGAGDFFGELALVATDRRTATVRASSEMSLIVMHSRDFHAMEQRLPKVAERIREAVRRRLPNPDVSSTRNGS